MAEEWREAPSFTGYEVSRNGRVRRIAVPDRDAGNRPDVASRDNGRGYKILTLFVCTKKLTRGVHQLVADAFIGPCPCGLEVNHIDGNKLNNSPENLEYVTKGENMRHAWANGLRPSNRGERSGLAKLTAQQVASIRSLKGTMSYREIGALFGITKTNVGSIVNRHTWKDAD